MDAPTANLMVQLIQCQIWTRRNHLTNQSLMPLQGISLLPCAAGATTQLTLTANCRAAALRETPPSTAATIRLRRSSEYGRPKPTGLRPVASLNHIARRRESPRFLPFGIRRRRNASKGGGLKKERFLP